MHHSWTNSIDLWLSSSSDEESSSQALSCSTLQLWLMCLEPTLAPNFSSGRFDRSCPQCYPFAAHGHQVIHSRHVLSSQQHIISSVSFEDCLDFVTSIPDNFLAQDLQTSSIAIIFLGIIGTCSCKLPFYWFFRSAIWITIATGSTQTCPYY